MADQHITIKLTIDGSGTLKKATTDVEKLNKATDKQTKGNKKLNKSNEDVIKGQKGIHQSNLSSAKGFSKMNQMLEGGGGSSGLVAAYATLAANVFAATAAFNAFRGAAAFQQLGEGFTFMANQAGRTMDLVVDRLKEVSGEALSTEQALQGASLAISAGFDTDDLEKLTKVARGASLALGRNMADAFDRLTRGAIKLEPEILDELGIMVRLDDATEAYAATIGKTANELTQFQRQTAFINAINEQGIAKYGELADAVEVNPYDKLAAAFGDLTKAGLNVLNFVLIPFANLFAGSQTAMIGGLTLFASTIITTMIPALGNMAKKSADAASAALELAEAEEAAVDSSIAKAEKDLGLGKKRTKTVKDLQRTIKEGGDVQKQAAKTELNLEKQLARAKAKKAGLSESASKAEKAAANRRIRDINREIAATKILGGADQARLNQAVVAEGARAAAVQSRIVAEATAGISQAGVIGGFKIASAAVKEYIAAQVTATATTGLFAKAQAFLAAKLGVTIVKIKLYGTALLTAIPVLAGIAIAVGVVMTVIGAMGDRFRKEVAGMETLKTVTEELDSKFQQLNKTIGNLGDTATKGDIRIRQIKQSSGIFLEVAAGIEEIETAAVRAGEARRKVIEGQDFGPRRAARLEGEEALKAFDEKQVEAAQDAVKKKSFGSLKDTLSEIASDTSAASVVLREQLEAEFKKQFTDYDSAGGLEAFITALKPEQFDKVSLAVAGAASNTQGWNSELTNLGRTIQEAEQDFSKFFAGASQKTEFDGIVKQFNTMSASIKELSGEDTEEGLKELFENSGEQLKKFRKKGESVEDFMARITDETDGLAVSFERLQKKTRTLQTDLKKLTTESKQLKTLSSFTAAGQEAFLDKQNDILDKQIELNQAIIDEIKLENQTEEVKQRIIKLNTENDALELKRKSRAEIIQAGVLTELENKKKILAIDEKTAKAAATQALNQEKILKLRTTGSADLSPREAQRAARKQAQDDFDFAVAKANLERTILKERYKLFVLEQHALYLQGEQSKERLALFAQTTAAAYLILEAQEKGIDAQIKGAETIKELVDAGGMSTGDPFSIAKSLQDITDKSEKFAGVGVLVSASLSPMVESFKELGDEGAAISNTIEKMTQLTATMLAFKFTVQELVSTLNELTPEDSDGLLSALGISNDQLARGLVAMQALSQAIGVMGSMVAANAEMQKAAIDKQIAAEKKLGNNSKASVARIEALEKKKTVVARKAFEDQKKMQIAQAAIAGLTGAVMAYASLAWIPVVGPALGAAVAGTIMALTAKNISLIKSQQFDGGADVGGSGPSTINVGSRDNKVDISQGMSGGELAYLRGQQGIGSNASNFTPTGAAGMRKGYQSGGEVLVGEQGPEVIRAPAGSTIIPNERMGGTSNVNFTINAVDAAGVEELLVAQRGNIIGMIREAANEHGEEFMEEVNTGAY